MRYGILTVDNHDVTSVVMIPTSYLWPQVQEQRDVLESIGYDTRGITEVVTLTEAKRRARRVNRGRT